MKSVQMSQVVTICCDCICFLLTGVSNTQKLLIPASHCISAAVQSSVQTEKSVGLRAQVSLQSLNYADNLSWF